MRDHDSNIRAILLAALVIAVVAALALSTCSIGDRGTGHDARSRQAAIEQRADDVSWLVLKDAARRHLAAVRSDAATLPDDELGDALIDYAQNGQRFFRTPRTDPTDRLAALKSAAAALNDPERPVRCHAAIRSKDDPRCEAYMKALVDVFGRDL